MEAKTQASLHTLEIYGTLSGLKVNVEKTEILWIGKKRHCKNKLCVTKELVWSNETFNLLGVKFSINIGTMMKINIDLLLKNVDKCPFTALPNHDQNAIVKLQHIFIYLT